MKKQAILFIIIVAALSQSCMTKKLLGDSQAHVESLRQDSARLEGKIADLQTNMKTLNNKLDAAQQQNSSLGQQAIDQQGQLSKSKEDLVRQRQRLEDLQKILDRQRQQSQELKAKMSEALNSFNSNELTVTQKNGKVYVSLSEGLLFPSGSAVVNPRGVDALAKLAAVLNANADISVNIEGHTDSIPIKGKYKDNWDLSTARANSIVRILTEDYMVTPLRVEASGHSWFDPVDTNSTPEGRAKNRRTEIILTPKLDEMYKLLES